MTYLTENNIISIQEEIRYYDLNTSDEAVSICKDYVLNEYNVGTDNSDAQDGFESCCRETGTFDNSTFHEKINNQYFIKKDINYFVANNVLIQLENPEKEIEITAFDITCSGTDLMIPSRINGLLVTRLADAEIDELGLAGTSGAIYDENNPSYIIGYMKLKSISFPNTLKRIGAYSFVGSDITNLVIPSSVISIGYKAFDGNPLENVEVISNAKFTADYEYSRESKSFNSNYADDTNHFEVFKYGGTCAELNQYVNVFWRYLPKQIITSDSNACEYVFTEM